MRDFYSYLHNGAGTYFSFVGNQLQTSTSSDGMELEFNPANLKDMTLAFGTNNDYFSGVRAMLVNWTMIGDGADILRTLKYTGKGYSEEVHLLVVRWNPDDDTYYPYYNGRFDLAQSKDTLTGYSAPCLDASVWGILSQNDDVKYSIDCSYQAENAVPILFDGITLRARYTYQPVASTTKMLWTGALNRFWIAPFILVNTDGDSSGIVTQNQSLFYGTTNYVTYLDTNPNIYFVKVVKDTVLKMKGAYTFDWRVDWPFGNSSGVMPIDVIIRNSNGTEFLVADNFLVSADDETPFITYSVTINTTFNLLAGEQLTLLFVDRRPNQDLELDYYFAPKVSNTLMDTDSKADASIVYGRRPLDVVREIVSKATDGKYTAHSVFYSTNKNKVLTCGNALRDAPNAVIQSSFKDWMESYDIEDWIGFRIINNQIWIEPIPVIYDDSTNLLDIGEVSDIEVEDASLYLCNEIKLNMPKQDYRRSSGRLEFNGLNTFSIHQFNVKKDLSLISPFRKDCYGMEFIRLDYQQQSTKDNSGDSDVFMVDITDQTGTANVEVQNYVEIEVNNSPLAPIINIPFQEDHIFNRHPVIRGVCQPNTTFNVYVDGLFDGTGTSDATPYGNFVYNIQRELSPFVTGQGSKDGIHLIEVTFTDLTGTTSARTVTIYDGVQPTTLASIKNGDNLYNNKPLIRGFMETGVSLPLIIDTVTVATVTGDGNGRWEYKITTPLTNAVHTVQIGAVSATFNVFSFVEIPLTTSFLDGFMLVNNLPLVEGVGKPGVVVELWLDYYPDKPIGTATIDANGNWSVQLVPLFKPDGFSVLTPIPNGSHIISTDLQILDVPVGISGFLLNRPAYTSIVGVLDNTVFNTRLTPKHNLLNRMRYWKSIFAQQPDTIIKFETGDKNIGFSTTLAGVTTKENDDVVLSDYTDLPLFIPYILNFTCETPFFFNEIMHNFSNGGTIKMTHQGFDIWCLPIGDMKVNDVTNNVQKWSLLVSAKTPLNTLLNLSSFVSNLSLMADTIYRSDYNTLHMVKYNYSVEEPEIHEDWFQNRNERWVNNPKYVQKIRLDDGLVDQIMTNFPYQRTIQLRAFDGCGNLKATYAYAPVTPSPIQPPEVLQEVTVDLNALGEGDFYFVIFVDYLAASISELVSIRKEHYGTILIDGSSRRNKTNVVFSNGWRAKVRVEGLVQKWIGDIESVINEDEIGDFDNLRAILSKKRTMLFGDGTGIPDWLYLKICHIILLDNLYIQRVGYTIAKDATVEPVDKIPGYPSYHYAVNFRLTDNTQGFNFNEFMPYNQIIDNAIMANDDEYIDTSEQKPLLSN